MNKNENYMEYMDIAPEVEKALSEDKPVVALESTIIFHGMPYPKNLECAERCEELLREKGVTPATIAIIGGRIKVGLNREEIDALIEADDVIKVSRRDIATVVAGKKNGATTVASTLLIAEMADIPVFATGGIGGVHRGLAENYDISADLPQLAKSNVCVVCAGAKSILDIGFTLEYLETLGVPVIGWRTDDFPAFYTRKSGFSVDSRAEAPEDVAGIMEAKWGLGIEGGILLACPVPEEYAMDDAVIGAAIIEAVASAEKDGIHGKESTPYILGKVLETTGGASLDTNMQLVWNNCRVAAEVAASYSNLRRRKESV